MATSIAVLIVAVTLLGGLALAAWVQMLVVGVFGFSVAFWAMLAAVAWTYLLTVAVNALRAIVSQSKARR